MSAEARAVTVSEGPGDALARLEADGFIFRVGTTFKTRRGWQRAMARAAVALYEQGDAGDDLRVPITLALLQSKPEKYEDELLAELVEALLPIESAALGLLAR
jgi:hypothetical protein